MEISARPTTPTPTPSPALAPVDIPEDDEEGVYEGVALEVGVEVGAVVDVDEESVGFGGPEVSKRFRRLSGCQSHWIGKEEKGGRTYLSRARLHWRPSSPAL